MAPQQPFQRSTHSVITAGAGGGCSRCNQGQARGLSTPQERGAGEGGRSEHLPPEVSKVVPGNSKLKLKGVGFHVRLPGELSGQAAILGKEEPRAPQTPRTDFTEAPEVLSVAALGGRVLWRVLQVCECKPLSQGFQVAQRQRIRLQYRRPGLDLWVGKVPYRRKCIPLQHSCLKTPMNREAWRLQSMGSPRVGHDLATKPPPHHREAVGPQKR